MIAALKITSVLLALSALAPRCTPPDETPPPPAPVVAPTDVYAFCGVDVDSPHAYAQAKSLADLGITATMGPCQDPGPGYTAAFVGTRYASPEEYMRLTELNASVGMKTIIYDARLWEPYTGAFYAANAFWNDQFAAGNIEAIDMGDEFDPNGPEWSILVQRWNIAKNVSPTAKPYTNHLSWSLDAAVRDLGTERFSFDQYGDDQGVAVAKAANPLVKDVMCAVNTLAHGPFTPTYHKIVADFKKLRAAGCDSWLVFGGVIPEVPGFGAYSLVWGDGTPTDWGYAVRDSVK